ncbi:MAG TPA: galactose-1-phosphate uridylyltransferase [Nitrospiraceae bacterium]|nr:galactose-1-phosphate uridylyltransferase [Nitrospiraceae bacterium]
MPELRQDPTTFDWVIIAKERAKRPDDLRRKGEPERSLPDHSPDCPFCPGNEARTPKEEAVYGGPDGWSIRVVPNKFAALSPEGDMEREEWKLFRKTHGYGRHEVIIESPRHNEFIPFMTINHVEDLIRAYRDRYHALRRDPNVRLIIIFKNHGAGAGTSLEHPHTQVVATPVVPPYIRRKYEVATQHYDNTGRCLQHDLQLAELEAGVRIVAESSHFVVLHPFASHYPFETWIMPREHKSSFGAISDDEIRDLARVLKTTLLQLHTALQDPDYNLIIHTSPADDEHKAYYLLHIQIIPRLTKAAGFELGSGIYINIVVPEETAAYIKTIQV